MIKTDYISKQDLKNINSREINEGRTSQRFCDNGSRCLTKNLQSDCSRTGLQIEDKIGQQEEILSEEIVITNCNSESVRPTQQMIPSVENVAVSLVPIQGGHLLSPSVRIEAGTAVSIETTLPKCNIIAEKERAEARTEATNIDSLPVCRQTEDACSQTTDKTTIKYGEIVNSNSSKSEYRTKKTMAEVLQLPGKWNYNEKNNNKEWQVVKRKSNKFISNTGTYTTNLDSKFKAADSILPLYISNVCKQTLEEDIIDYIFSKTQERVSLEKIHAKKEKHYDSYKLYVPRNKLQMFLNDDLWPEGICFRRFIVFSDKIRPNRNAINREEKQ